jgi:hypothetical protein
MTCQMAACWWAWCPGCGKERRLARGRQVMRTHNRWDPSARVMVACEGSGQPPRLNGHGQATPGNGRAQRAREGAAVSRPGAGSA